MKIKSSISIILFAWIMVLCESCIGKYFIMSKLSNDIYNNQVSFFGKDIFLESINDQLQYSNWYHELGFSTKNDTVFLLEHAGIQGDYYFSIWNRKDTLSYSNVSGRLESIHGKIVFSKYMMKLVSKWDIDEIKEEENTHSNLLPQEMVYATRIILKNNKYTIDCIRFKNFFDLERDGMDFYN